MSSSSIPSLLELSCEVFSQNINYLQKKFKKLPTEFIPLEIHEKLISLCARKGTLSDETLLLFLHESLVKLRISNVNMLVGDSSILKIASICKHLTELSLYGTSNISEKVLSQSFSSLPNLEVLNLSKSTVASKMVLDAASIYCPKVKSLTLNRNPQVDDSFFETCLGNWKELLDIGLLTCLNITGLTIERIANLCRKLEFLNISKCNAISDQHLIPFIQKSSKNFQALRISRMRKATDATLLAIIENFPNLNTLDISSCSFSEEATIKLLQTCTKLLTINLHKDSDAIIEALVTNCIQIEEIVLPRTGSITDKGAMMLGSCKFLKTLNLSKCTKVSDSSLLHLIKNVTCLKDLNISKCTSLTSNMLTGVFPIINTNLGVLDVGNIGSLKPEFFETLSMYSPNITSLTLSQSLIQGDSLAVLSKNFPSMRSLILSSNPLSNDNILTIVNGNWRLRTININDCVFVTDSALLNLLLKCTQLENLYASKCIQIRDLSCQIEVPITKCQLLELDLSYCSEITNKTLEAILSLCDNLQSLNISKCEKLTDSIVHKMIHFQNLFSLNISKTMFSDDFVEILTKSLTRLMNLNLAGCVSLTDKSATAILTRLPFLLTVHFTLIPGITDNSIRLLLANKGNTKIQLLALTSTGVTIELLKALETAFPTMQIHK